MVETTLTPRQRWSGNPPTDLHQPRPSDLVQFDEEIIAGINAAEQRLDDVEAQDGTLAGRATALEGRATTLEADVAVLEAAQTSGLLVRATWAELQSDVGGSDGAGAEVMTTDTGTHSAASATGYDGASVDNSGRYAWNATWSRWVRIGDSLAVSLAAKSSIQLVAVTQTNVSDNYFITEPVSLDQLSPTAGFSMTAPSDRQVGEFGGVILEVAGLNQGDPRQVRYYPGDATNDQIGQMAWKAGDRLEFGPLTAAGWFPLLWPPRPTDSAQNSSDRNSFYTLRANQIAAIRAQE